MQLAVGADHRVVGSGIAGVGGGGRVRGAGDAVYAVNVEETAGTEWFIYRPARVLRSFDSNELLGNELRFLGTAHVERFGEVSTLRITSAREEILFGFGAHFEPRLGVLRALTELNQMLPSSCSASVWLSRGSVRSSTQGVASQVEWPPRYAR